MKSIRHAMALAGAGALSVGFAGSGIAPVAHADVARAQEEQSLPTGKQLLERSIEAGGGVEARKGITSRITKGKMTTPTPGVIADVVVYDAAPGKQLMRISYRGMTMFEAATDGTDAWQVDPATGAQVVEGKQKDELLWKAQLGEEGEPADRYTVLDTLGRTAFDGQEAFEVKVVTSAGSEVIHYYAADSGHLIGRHSSARPEEKALETKVSYSDFREVDGLILPFKSVVHFPSTGTNQTLTITSVEHNAAIDESMFVMPASLKSAR